MEIDPETLQEIRAILRKECVVEVTVTFFDESERNALEPVDIGCSLEFEAGTPREEKVKDFRDLLGTLVDAFEGLEETSGA